MVTIDQLISRAEANVWIAAEIIWKPLQDEAGSFDESFGLDSTESKQCILEITLTKNPSTSLRSLAGYHINEALLEEEAFQPKTFQVRLEQGRFLTPFDRSYGLTENPEFGLQLSFEPSPYPPREQWKTPKGAPDAMKFWERKTFCSKRL